MSILITPQVVQLGIGLLIACATPAMATLEQLSDHALSEAAGQALYHVKYTQPSGTGAGAAPTDFGFYRLGITGALQLNLNIKSLKLGCDGANATGACDINIDNLSISGNSSTRNGRVNTDAVLNNPFIEFAIKNPNSASTREFTGVRFGSESALGLLTAGTENSTTPNGINNFSGFLQIQSGIGSTAAERSKVKGLANTSAAYFDAGVNQITGRLVAIGLADARFRTTSGGFTIPAMQNLPFETAQIIVSQSRLSSVPIASAINVPQIVLGNNYPAAGQTNNQTVNGVPNTTVGVNTRGGPVDAVITGCSNTVFFIPACLAAPTGRNFSNINMSGTVSNIKANVTINQSLGYIHSLPINSPFSLSLQKQAVRWPDAVAADVAQKGWWMSFSDPVDLGQIIPTDLIDISPLFPQLKTEISNYLQANPATTNDLAAVISGDGLDANIGNINLSGSPLSLLLSNLQLNGQNFAPNCYGSLSFC
jgi:hypothetical protein